jgi:hypothetical protein
MLRFWIFLFVAQTIPLTTHAHEFWIESERLLIPQDAHMEPVLMIGEHPEGQAYAFQPQAYALVIWSGPGAQVELSRLPLSAPDPSRAAFAPGLHSLSVSTYPQKLTYASLDDFRAFLKEIGKEDLIATDTYELPADGEVHETYRRFSKTIVHFSDRSGEDGRTGLMREWVWQDGGFTLFENNKPSADQKTHVSCASGPFPSATTEFALFTDRNGTITPPLPEEGRCLINTVFVEYDAVADRWRSDWVSLFLLTPGN